MFCLVYHFVFPYQVCKCYFVTSKLERKKLCRDWNDFPLQLQKDQLASSHFKNVIKLKTFISANWFRSDSERLNEEKKIIRPSEHGCAVETFGVCAWYAVCLMWAHTRFTFIYSFTHSETREGDFCIREGRRDKFKASMKETSWL